jgi:hypothetical protein
MQRYTFFLFPHKKAKKIPNYLGVSNIIPVFAPTNPARFPQEQRLQRDTFLIICKKRCIFAADIKHFSHDNRRTQNIHHGRT